MNDISSVRLSAVITCIVAAALSVAGADKTTDPVKSGPGITRNIDASKYFRRFPRMPEGRNTSIQKAPAPVLAEVSERELGRPKITKCWLNMDEMWDYRTRKFVYDFPIGVHKYDGIKEKHGETWGGVAETRIPFPEYLKAFGKHSDEVMLTIRRYERDILDGKLGVTMDDWREMFKIAVVHYRSICPNLRYIEVCNEYALKGFIGCNDKEYYMFYKTAYEAVNQANKELGLKGKDRVLVGGPAVTGDIVKKIDLFCENFSKDDSKEKCLDFVSWHEYSQPYQATALREGVIQAILKKHGLEHELPMFVTEHDPVHPKVGPGSYHVNLINAAGLVKSLYFTDVYSPNITLMPWVLYHHQKIQTCFMWFFGPNEPDTKAEELHMFASGCSMKLLSMHREWEIAVDNSLDRDEIVLASIDHQALAVHTVNYNSNARDVQVSVDNLDKVFTSEGVRTIRYEKYLIDTNHCNAVTDPTHLDGLQVLEKGSLVSANGKITLTHSALKQHGILMWILKPGKVGTPLTKPVSGLPMFTAQPAGMTFDAKEALSSAVAEAEASIERNGSKFQVKVSKSDERPGITFRPGSDLWSMAGMKELSAKVKNTGKHNLNVHLVVDGVNPNRTRRKNCAIESVSIAPGKETTLSIALAPTPPHPLKWLMQGNGKALPSISTDVKNGLNASRITGISVYVYHPGAEYTYEVSELKVTTD